MTAPGRYIPVMQRMAAFASMLLPLAERDELRKRRALASEVLERFEMHHIVFHAHDGQNDWHNLHPMLVADHRKRTQSDIGIIAKSKRIQKKQAHHMFRMTEVGFDPVKGLSYKRINGGPKEYFDKSDIGGWGIVEPAPKRKLPSRPFPKGRKLRNKK